MRPRKRSPLVTSVSALRAIATSITMLSLAGMTVFAGGHLHNTAAPLQPVAPSAATAAPVTPTGASTGRLQLSRGISTSTTTRPVTTTHRS